MAVDEKNWLEVNLYDPETGTRAFVVVHRLIGGICGGGVRMSPNVTLNEVAQLARTMTYKFAAMGVQVGGAKSGIVFDPRSPKKKEADAAFGTMAMPLLSTVYTIGEDMGTNADDVTIINNAAGVNPIEMAKKKAKERGIELNLPENVEFSKLGGESFEEIITGYGIAEAADEAVGLLSLQLSGATVAVQGFGTVGSITARNLARRGAKVIAVADIEGTIINKDGLDVEKLIAAKDQHGTIDRSKLDFPFKKDDREGWLKVDAQIIVPAAVAGSINENNVKSVTAQLILEGANIPITPAAQGVLTAKGTPIIPDFIANAGAAAGFGLVLTGQCPVEKVFEEFSKRIRDGVRYSVLESKKSGITTRQAAINLANKNLEAWGVK
jgi:glutamate dehydrogenase (NAD(P)+)